jgi:hypothetical protein
LAKEYPELTPYQYASGNPIMNIDLDGLEGFWAAIKDGDFIDAFNSITWDDINEGADNINRNFNPLGIALHGSYQVITGKDALTGEKVSRLDAAGNLVVLFIYHRAGVVGSAPGEAAALERQIAANTVKTTDKVATVVHDDNPAAAENNAANSTNEVTKETPKSNAASEAKVKAGTKKAGQLKTNAQSGTTSEEIVQQRLQSQLGSDEAILRKPRIYINDENGKITSKYATPDFAIYNTQTGQITKIVDAKDGGAIPSKAQKQLNERGGVFKGSSRAPQAKAQSINKNLVDVESTNVNQQKPQ